MTAERADLGVVPWRRGDDELAAALTRWADATGRGVITDVRSPASGMANETVLFRLDGDPLVARLAPLPGSHPTFPTYDLDFQRRVMQLVRARTSVPVPRVVHLEESNEWFGVPFLVIEAVDGVVPGDNPPYVFDGWLARASDAEQRRLEESSIRVLVELHQIEDDGDTTAFLRPRAPGATRARPAPGVPARVLRLGVRGHTRARRRACPRRARRHDPGQRSHGVELGRQPDRQHPLPRLRAGGRARLGDGDGGPGRRSTSDG